MIYAHHLPEVKRMRRMGTWAQTTQVVLAVLSISVLLFRLESVPAFFYDEGFFAQIAKNTILYGQYGSIFYQDVVPAQLSVGPTVLLPVAAVFHFFGIGIWQARIVGAVAGFLTLLLLYAISAKLYNARSGIIVWLLALSTLQLYSRGLYGEVPALCFFLAAIWCWWRSMEFESIVSAGIAGLALGMMLVSKPQMLLLAPAFVVAIGANLAYHRCWRLRSILVMTLAVPLPIVLSVLFQAQSLGWDVYWSYIFYDLTHSTQASVAPASLGLIFRQRDRAIETLRNLAVGIPCLLLSLRDCRERSPRGLIRTTLLVATVIWLSWFIVYSPGWHRYGFPGYLLLDLFLAARLSALAGWLPTRLPERHQRWPMTVLEIALVILIPIRLLAALASSAADPLPTLVAAIERRVEPDAVIESYEWPVDTLSNRRFHHPSLAEHLPRVRHILFAERGALPTYDFWTYEPDYLVRGPMGLGMQAYPQSLLDKCGELIEEHGPYSLFRLADRDCFLRYAP